MRLVERSIDAIAKIITIPREGRRPYWICDRTDKDRAAGEILVKVRRQLSRTQAEMPAPQSQVSAYERFAKQPAMSTMLSLLGDSGCGVAVIVYSGSLDDEYELPVVLGTWVVDPRPSSRSEPKAISHLAGLTQV